MKINLLTRFIGSALVLSLLPGCEAVVAERGNMVDNERLAKVVVGASKDDVYQALGSATTVGTFDDNAWYYMGQRTEQESFFDPEVTDRRIVEIDFDDADKVATIKQYGIQNGQQVDMVETTTPVAGHETTLAEDIFGRSGGSSKDKKKKGGQ